MRTLIALSALTLGFALACDSPAKEQAAADLARQEAADKAQQAQLDTDKARLLGIANAERVQQEATLSLATAKSDYRIRVASLRADLDKRIADRKAGIVGASAVLKQKNDAEIVSVRAMRDSLGDDIRLIDASTSAEWANVQSRVDKDLSDGKALLAKS